MTHKIYIASSLDNGNRVKELNKILTEAGHSITYDWTTHGRVEDHTELVKIAEGEYNGVRDCDVFLMVLPARLGSHFEFGAAFALSKRIIILEEVDIEEMKSFYFLPGIARYETIEDVLSVITD